jgi:hypothetical protein
MSRRRTFEVPLVHPTGPSIGGEEGQCTSTILIELDARDGTEADIPDHCPVCGMTLGPTLQADLRARAEREWADWRDYERYDGTSI